jgi:hypothetical protein
MGGVGGGWAAGGAGGGRGGGEAVEERGVVAVDVFVIGL